MLRGFKKLVGPALESSRRESVSHDLSHSKYKTVEIYNTFHQKEVVTVEGVYVFWYMIL